MDTILFLQTSGKTPSHEMVDGVFRYLKDSRWAVHFVEQPTSAHGIRRFLEKWNPVGCIVNRGQSYARSPIRLLNGRPTVYIDQNPRTAGESEWAVNTDSSATVRMALRELAHGKPCHYAFVRTPKRTFWGDEREAAFRQAILEMKADGTALDDDPDLPERLAALPRPCGLLGANDSVAQDAIAAATQAGVDVPNDLRVIGINNDEFICTHTRPTLTSVHPDFEGCGYLAAATLHQAVQNPRFRPTAVRLGPVGVVRRGSTRTDLRKDPRVTRAVDYIATHYADPNLATDVLATVMGCSRSLADLRFRKSSGYTIRNEIRRVRIEAAKRLLARPGVQISAIPSLCGYASLPTFAHTFKAETGLTMGDFRRHLAAAACRLGPNRPTGPSRPCPRRTGASRSRS